MELISITTGSWFPRTKLHLKEYFEFLKNGVSHLELDPSHLKELHRKLAPRDVRYVGGHFDRVYSTFGEIDVEYMEDGLLLLHSSVKDFASDVARLREFYDGAITESLSYLYSIGTPVVSFRIPHIGERPLVVLGKDISDDEARIFCAEHDEGVHFIARHTDRTVYFSKNLILIDDRTGGAGTTRVVVDHLILFREYEHKLRHYLELHRNLWEEIAAVQKREKIPASELPFVRDALVDHQRDMAVIMARIGQMRTYLKERQEAIDSLGIVEDMRAVEAYRFGKLESSTAYIERLWEMLDQYLSSTVDLTTFLHQENLQKEIGIQQFIFLVAAVAGVLALGDMTGARVWFEFQGERVDGEILAFHIKNLLLFGGAAIGISIFIQYVVRPLIQAIGRIRAGRLLGRFTRPGEGSRTDRHDDHRS